MATAMGGGEPKMLAMPMAIGDSAQRAVVQSAKAFGKPKSLDSKGAEPIVMVVLHAEVAKIGPRSFRINNRFSKSNRPKDT